MTVQFEENLFLSDHQYFHAALKNQFGGCHAPVLYQAT
jgi:hypothetical protein